MRGREWSTPRNRWRSAAASRQRGCSPFHSRTCPARGKATGLVRERKADTAAGAATTHTRGTCWWDETIDSLHRIPREGGGEGVMVGPRRRISAEAPPGQLCGSCSGSFSAHLVENPFGELLGRPLALVLQNVRHRDHVSQRFGRLVHLTREEEAGRRHHLREQETAQAVERSARRRSTGERAASGSTPERRAEPGRHCRRRRRRPKARQSQLAGTHEAVVLQFSDVAVRVELVAEYCASCDDKLGPARVRVQRGKMTQPLL